MAAVDMQIVDSSVRSIDTGAVDMPFMWFHSHRETDILYIERGREQKKNEANFR